jgi:predicted ester cyclase
MRFPFVTLSLLLVPGVLCAQSPKEVVRQYIEEMWNKNKPEPVEKLVVADYRHTNSSGEQWTGTERIKNLLRTLHGSIAELQYTIDAINVEGDLVATRATVTGIHVKPLLGFTATNKRITYAEWFWQRIKDGRIIEGWTLTNAEAVLRRNATPQ